MLPKPESLDNFPSVFLCKRGDAGPHFCLAGSVFFPQQNAVGRRPFKTVSSTSSLHQFCGSFSFSTPCPSSILYSSDDARVTGEVPATVGARAVTDRGVRHYYPGKKKKKNFFLKYSLLSLTRNILVTDGLLLETTILSLRGLVLPGNRTPPLPPSPRKATSDRRKRTDDVVAPRTAMFTYSPTDRDEVQVWDEGR